MRNYGYKVCYMHDGNYHCQFKTYTYKQAVKAVCYYVRYPPVITKRWKIIPISRKEIKSGIWREMPF